MSSYPTSFCTSEPVERFLCSSPGLTNVSEHFETEKRKQKNQKKVDTKKKEEFQPKIQ